MTSAELRASITSPEFWWNPLDGRPGMALVFGRGRRRRVALSGALVMSYYIDPLGFRTVLLHELAHLRNRDVTLTYVAISMTWAFMITALLPNAVVVFTHKPDLSDILLTVAEVGTFGLCALLTRAAISVPANSTPMCAAQHGIPIGIP